MPVVTDFSSAEYWSNRFETEKSFEWLISNEDLIPFIIDNLPNQFNDLQEETLGQEEEENVLNILHFGSGTSSLGFNLQNHLNSNLNKNKNRKGERKRKIQIYDSDYVKPPLINFEIPFLLLDVLNLNSLKKNSVSKKQKWDLIIDKSTCDAISCSSNLSSSSLDDNNDDNDNDNDQINNPIERLLFNLSKITLKNSRWISISYSSNRFNDNNNNNNNNNNKLENEINLNKFGWKLIKKQMISTTYIPGGKMIKDFKSGKERIVHEPETGIWMYILDRI
ncbi:uncharacterized protein I206_104486 [Kwoniella pini CBS 10737]|uniref:Uncharacterized protein n=1 Tax=Kwoniella pini CBS 10737 TaxID=1296096 RepID=A0A1B9I6Z5_9TREE|nr:uncharacterized protein I206_02016 [Kwoniella pini CBS 10737]OCF51302.1 hypothetical protein I206_02016 [Kwoniella pini CBS 10737]